VVYAGAIDALVETQGAVPSLEADYDGYMITRPAPASQVSGGPGRAAARSRRDVGLGVEPPRHPGCPGHRLEGHGGGCGVEFTDRPDGLAAGQFVMPVGRGDQVRGAWIPARSLLLPPPPLKKG